MTTHSVCHPGRPGPHGEGHVGSPGLAAFQRAKSSGERLPSATSTRAPARSSDRAWLVSAPYPSRCPTSNQTPPSVR